MDDAPRPPPSPPPPKRQRLTVVLPLKYYAEDASKEERELYKTFVNAAYRGDLETVQRMLETDAVPVDCRYICEEEPEPEPLPAGAIRVLRMGPTEYYTRNGTALHAACEHSLNVAVIQELLNAGAQVDLEDKNGATPLLILLMRRKDIPRQVEITRMLLAAGCNVNAKGNNGCTPLINVGREDGMDEIFSMLLNASADVTCRYEDSGWNVLHVCCLRDSAIEKVRLLLDHGVDVKQQSAHGRTALHLAVEWKNINVIRLLLQHDSEHQDANRAVRLIDCQDEKGHTVLHGAIKKKSLELVRELLQWKPNLKLKAYENFTPLHMAAFEISENDTGEGLEMLRCLVEHPNGYGLDSINEHANDLGTALHLAIEKDACNMEVIEYLSDIIDVRIQDVNGNTALHSAMTRDEAAEILPHVLLSRYGMEAINIQNHQGRTALHDAITHDRARTTVRAIASVADVNIIDRDGKTPLHCAAESKKRAFASILLDRMADVSVRDRHGNTAFVLACSGTQHNRHQLSNIFALYRHGVAYGNFPNMI